MRGGREAEIRITTLVFWRSDFGLLGDLLGQILWLMSLERVRLQESLFFKDHLFCAQEGFILTIRKSIKAGRSPAWMNQELLNRFKQKKKAWVK